MAWTKVKTAIVIGVGVLVVAGSAEVTVNKIEENDSWRSIFHLYSQSALLAGMDKTTPQITILPTIHPKWGFSWFPASNGRMIGINASVTNLLQVAYQQRPSRMIFSEPAPAGKYDFIANLPQGSAEAFRQKIKEQFGLAARVETVKADLWVLKISDPEKLKTIASKSSRPHTESSYGKITIEDKPVSGLADTLEGLLLKAPVLDQTGLSERYDFTLHWDSYDKSKRTPMIVDQLRQIGLELVPTNMPVEMLVVEKAQ